ncbi:type I-E CRISPR-associated protein Cas6/Cse3/CasE [Streptomyces sp. NPDC032472]|uniref:type I-E CRISPR-associated protein Cas6/Cse3/CasE n=1 Tax=Streptomyces sp. NPDC032472 TaxID=3155018 RepID=UPI00340D393D
MPKLSRIPLAPLRPGARKLLQSPQAMHAAVLGAVAYHPEPGRTLWRLDADNRHRPYLYVLTQVEPDWTAMTEQAGWQIDDPNAKPAVADYTRLLAGLRSGQEYAFRLTAAPVQNVRNPNKPSPLQKARMSDETRRSFRMGHRTTAHQLQWFTSRVKKFGFDLVEIPATVPAAPGILPFTDRITTEEPVLDVRVTGHARLVFTKTETRPDGTTFPNTVALTTATYAGTLRVTDPASLGRALLAGIGPGKGYGCGLLTLAAV